MSFKDESLIKEYLEYDPLTGIFKWKKDKGKRAKSGSVAGWVDKSGYVKIGIENQRFRAHRLAWFYMYGIWPNNEIDHINQIKNDNRIANLREVTTSENQQNTNKQKNNKSGFKGVSWNSESKKWVAQIAINKKRHSIGYFSTAEEAFCAYKIAAAKLHTHNPIAKI